MEEHELSEQQSAAVEVADAPPLAGPVEVSDQFWALDRRNIRVDQIAGTIFSCVMLFAGLVTIVVVWFNVGFSTAWFIVAGLLGVGLLMLFAACWFWPPLEYRYQSWRLDQSGLEIRRGVLWRHRVTIPLGRVQHADVSQGPLQRPFGIGTLTVHTAGTQNASIQLEGLAHETAIELRDLIVRQRDDQNVV